MLAKKVTHASPVEHAKDSHPFLHNSSVLVGWCLGFFSFPKPVGGLTFDCRYIATWWRRGRERESTSTNIGILQGTRGIKAAWHSHRVWAAAAAAGSRRVHSPGGARKGGWNAWRRYCTNVKPSEITITLLRIRSILSLYPTVHTPLALSLLHSHGGTPLLRLLLSPLSTSSSTSTSRAPAATAVEPHAGYWTVHFSVAFHTLATQTILPFSSLSPLSVFSLSNKTNNESRHKALLSHSPFPDVKRTFLTLVFIATIRYSVQT